MSRPGDEAKVIGRVHCKRADAQFAQPILWQATVIIYKATHMTRGPKSAAVLATTVTFHFGAAGAGISWGLKLPKIGKINLPKIRGKSVGGVVAPAAFPNIGKICILDTFNGDELTCTDTQGACALLASATGLLLTAGVNAGVVAGAGVGGFLGRII